MFNYKADLFLKAQVPENKTLEPHIKQSIEFDILCPVSGCKQIKANGFEKKLKPPVQTYKCNIHHRHFFAHTSWVMVKLTEIVIMRVLLAVFSSSTSSVELADRYKSNESTLSRLVLNCETYVDSIISRINKDKEQYRKQKLPALLSSVIWIDETFFKVGKKTWILILAIDYNGRVLGWKFGKTRNAKDITDVLVQVGQEMPNWSVVIGDGATTYAKAIRSFKKRAYLIQQFHTHPWEKAKITEFTPIGKYKVREDIIELKYDAFVGEETQIAGAIQREYTIDKPSKKRGRKKGVKNGQGKKKIKKKNKLKRGPKSPFKSGRIFQFGHTVNFLETEWLQAKPKSVNTPDKEIVDRLLNLTFMIFGNKSIVSNRIESFNSQVKLALPERGMHKEVHLKNRVDRFIQINNGDTAVSSLEMTLPVSARMGFNNLNQFFIHNIHQISLRREWI